MSNPLLNRLLFTLFLTAVFCIAAQDTAAQATREELMRVYDSATIHSIGRFYIKGNSRIRFRELRKEFISPITNAYYRNARADRAWGGVLAVTAASALVTGILVRKKSTTFGNILSGVAIALNLGSLHFTKRSAELTDRAIWHRNREILFGTSSITGSSR